MAIRSELAQYEAGVVAFGETLGMDVPTRYSPHIHDALDSLMALDCLITPVVLGMSSRTVWLCRFLTGLLLALRTDSEELPLRRRLELEAGVGVLLVLLALWGTVTRRPLDRAYLLLSGVVMIGNSMMTEL